MWRFVVHGNRDEASIRPTTLDNRSWRVIDKRREIAGRTESQQAQMRQAVADLDHVEAALRIMKPDLDLEEVMPRPVPPPHAPFKGEVSRIVLDCLRQTARPLSTREITTKLMQARGLNVDDRKVFKIIQIRTTACLGNWKRRGYLKTSPGTGIKGAMLWEIADNPVTETSYDRRLVP